MHLILSYMISTNFTNYMLLFYLISATFYIVYEVVTSRRLIFSFMPCLWLVLQMWFSRNHMTKLIQILSFLAPKILSYYNPDFVFKLRCFIDTFLKTGLIFSVVFFFMRHRSVFDTKTYIFHIRIFLKNIKIMIIFYIT